MSTLQRRFALIRRHVLSVPEPPATSVVAGPPDDAAPERTATEPEPIAPEPAPMSGNGTGDGDPKPEQEGGTIPPNWRPNTEGVAFARARGYTKTRIGLLAGEYIAHNTDKGITSKDWHATWRLWVLRDLTSGPPPMGGEAKHRRG